MTPIRVLIVAGAREQAGWVLQVLREGGYDAFGQRAEDAPSLATALSGGAFDLAVAFHPTSPLPAPETIAGWRQQGCDFPVLVLGEPNHDDDAADLLAAGAADYLPADQWDRLAAAARRVLEDGQLRASETRLRWFVEGSNDGFWEWHVPTGRLHYTTRWAEMLGFAPGEIEANISAWRWLVHPADWAGLWDKLQLHLRGKLPAFESEHRMRTKAGEWCWILARGKVVVRDAEGRPLRVAGSQTDNTDRRTAEEELWQSQAELSAIYNHAPLMMLLVDDENRIRRFNQALQEFTGLPAEQIAGRRIGEALRCAAVPLPPALCGAGDACGACPLQQTIRECRAKDLELRRHEIHLPIQRGERAQEAALLVSVTHLRVAEQGVLFVCLEDVTHLKRADARIREQAALLDIARDAIYVQDLDGRIVYWNHSAETLFGWPLEEVLGQSADFLLFDPGLDQTTEARRSVLEREEWSGELSVTRRDGSRAIVQSHWTLVRDQANQPKSVLVVSVDLTEKKKLEAHLQRIRRLESIGLLAGGIAHDLNNALGPIIMGLQLLRDRLPDLECRTILETMQTSAQRGASIVKQVHTFARGTPVAATLVDLARFLERFVGEFRAKAPPTLTVQLELAPALPAVPGDEIQLAQALEILCDNAREAMKETGALTVSATPLTFDLKSACNVPGARPGDFVVIGVSDTGPGMSPEVLDKAFDPFYTTKDFGQGVGMGLATALGIVKGHGGFMQAESELGQGSRFRLFLPIKP